jgi:indole-3-glycerol phosphate synthase
VNRILEKIIARKSEDLQERKKRLTLQELRGQVKRNKESGSFYRAITQVVNNPAIIAEVKFASPTNLNMGVPEELLSRVKQYEEAGADVISIITEKHFFKGDISFVKEVKKTVSLPVLQKDFVIDEYQIYEARQAQADAFLLISRLLDGEMLRRFVFLSKQLGIEPVVEINDEKDLEKAVATGTRFIAVNSRDLDTFEVDVMQACNLMKKIPERFIRLGFCGIASVDEVRQYREAGARGVLAGTSLMKAGNIGKFIDEIMV